jgi:hypothetical protein
LFIGWPTDKLELMEHKNQIATGNVSDIAQRGWIMGHFMEGPDWAKQSGFEIKWGEHKKGGGKADFGVNKTAGSLDILVRGKYKFVWLEDGVERSATLSAQGDYMYWPPGVAHRSEMLEDTLIITVRWPSVPGDQELI